MRTPAVSSATPGFVSVVAVQALTTDRKGTIPVNTQTFGTDRRRPSVVRSIALGLVIVTVVAGVGACSGSRGPDATDQQAPPSASGAPLTPPIEPPSIYRTAVTTSVVNAFHARPDEMRSELQREPGATLMNLAKPLGIGQDQLTTILLTALKDAGDARVAAHAWTTQQAALEQQFWAAQSEGGLIAEISRWIGQP